MPSIGSMRARPFVGVLHPRVMLHRLHKGLMLGQRREAHFRAASCDRPEDLYYVVEIGGTDHTALLLASQ